MDQAEYIKRLGICRRCPHAKTKISGTHCEVCGCNIRAKAKLSKESCPLNKW